MGLKFWINLKVWHTLARLQLITFESLVISFDRETKSMKVRQTETENEKFNLKFVKVCLFQLDNSIHKNWQFFINRLSRFSATFSSQWCSTTNWKFSKWCVAHSSEVAIKSTEGFFSTGRRYSPTCAQGIHRITRNRTTTTTDCMSSRYSKTFRNITVVNFIFIETYCRCKKSLHLSLRRAWAMSTRRSEDFQTGVACFSLAVHIYMLKLMLMLAKIARKV